MKKKSVKKNLGKIITCVSILFALVAFFMMFAPAAVAEVLGKTQSYSGIDLAFGYVNKTDALVGTVETRIFSASANILTYILIAIGIVCAVVSLFGKGGKILPFIAVASLIAAGVLYFLTIQLCAPYTKLEGDLKDEYISTIKEQLKLGAGAIVGGIFSVLAGVAALVPLFVKSK